MSPEPVVLVAEDEALVRIMIEEALNEHGFNVVVASDGSEAIALLSEGDTPLVGIVTDVRMGAGPSGWEVARSARRLRADMPVVYVTGDSANEWVIEGVPRSRLLQKPFMIHQLAGALHDAIIAASPSN